MDFRTDSYYAATRGPNGVSLRVTSEPKPDEALAAEKAAAPRETKTTSFSAEKPQPKAVAAASNGPAPSQPNRNNNNNNNNKKPKAKIDEKKEQEMLQITMVSTPAVWHIHTRTHAHMLTDFALIHCATRTNISQSCMSCSPRWKPRKLVSPLPRPSVVLSVMDPTF